MGNPRGFLEVERQKRKLLPVADRLGHYHELEVAPEPEALRAQASRCMDCGIPFCHQGCPLGNLIPEWNDHTYTGAHEAAARALLETNNFPEITGRVCPAPCEAACVLNIDEAPVAIKDIEHAIADHLLEAGLEPRPPLTETGRTVAVVGSGPAGLAAAQQLRRAGHAVTVYERDARPGGLLRYGIPDFKLDKSVLDARIEQMRAEGVRFVCRHAPTTAELREHHGVVLAVGARIARDLEVAGRELEGIHLAMDFLQLQNERVGGERPEQDGIHAEGKHVIVLGGGDTGSDCIGTSHRHGALSVTSLELLPMPPERRAPGDVWPAWPRIFRTSSSHEEGGERLFAVQTQGFEADSTGARVAGLRVTDVRLEEGGFVPVPESERTLPADLVLLAMGFVATEELPELTALGIRRTERGLIATTSGFSTHAPNVVVCGDAYRGASLVVWAIADGRKAAAELDALLRA